MRYRPLSELITIEEIKGLWYILDAKHMSGMYDETGAVTKFGPYPTEEAACNARELLYHSIYGDIS